MIEEYKMESNTEQIIIDNTPLDKALRANKRKKFVQKILNSIGMKLFVTAFFLIALFSSTFVVAYDKVQKQQVKAALNQIPKAEVNLPSIVENVTPTPTTIEEAKFCGGIAKIECEEGYECKTDGSYPNAGGTCIKL